jgi:DNA-nicking Smr family endonuclease
MSRGRRAPTPEELRLWADVARTVAPLGERAPLELPAEPTAVIRKVAPATPVQAPVRSRTGVADTTRLAGIDKRTVSRLGRGSVAIDARLDLHGMTQAAAHGRLVRFLKQAQADGARLVLVITGKGKPADEPAHGEERGVLRRAVPLWLSAAEMRPFVVGFGEAAAPHGGAGALYVRVRRARAGRA